MKFTLTQNKVGEIKGFILQVENASEMYKQLSIEELRN